MSKFNLEVNAAVTFDSVDEARLVGQAVDRLLGAHKRGSVKIYAPGTLLSVALIPDLYDRSKAVVGSQEAEAKAQSLVAAIEKTIAIEVKDTLSSAEEFWNGFILDSKNTGNVDFESLEALVVKRLPDSNASEVITEAFGTVAANEAARAMRSITSARAGAAKRAASQQPKGSKKK
jgi:hypothetical protein